MFQKVIVGPIDQGLRNDRTAFVIDDDSFPTLINAYQWRGRVKRKRGTSILGRLNRFSSTSGITSAGITTITFNLFTIAGITGEPNAAVVPGTANFSALAPDAYTFTDLGNTTFSATGKGQAAGSTINYATGTVTLNFNVPLTGGAVGVNAFNYYPDLPVMGLEDLVLQVNQFPGTLGFDTKYSYNISTSSPYLINDVSFYKNPAADPINLPGYIPKTTWTPTTWNGQDYQQFWTTNYQGALWTTNGLNVPFDPTNVGMQYKPITNVVINAVGPPAIATITIVAHGLVVGDFVYINEVLGNTGINFQTGYVIVVVDANNIQVEFPNATLGGAYTSGGIAQYLTNRSDITKDSLRWYDGDPTNGSSTAPVFVEGKGWVNFSPPLSFLQYSIDDRPARQYYLVGAKMILDFKDRLLFIGPVIQTSTAGSQIYLQDVVIYSQNGTPFYTSSFTGDPGATNTEFHAILAPTDQTATAPAYWEDQTGFGGFVAEGSDQIIATASSNEDVLIIGLTVKQTFLAYTGNDIIPFNFYTVNSELGSGSTFSIVNTDKGVITRGNRGYIITGQKEAARIDPQIPDQVFQIRLLNNGTERMCSQRDYVSEWIYFTYPSNELSYNFPNQTLQYNYKDDSWAIFNECYTTYGTFRRRTGFTWATVGLTFPTWNDWNEPWNAGSSTLLQQQVIAGNQQGFIVFRDDGTSESNSLYIQNIAASVVTSPDHTLTNGDYIIISGALGTVGTQVNGKIFSVSNPMNDTFILNPPIAGGTYLGGGVIKRMYVPQIQTKQFPMAWGIGRKTRIGPTQFLFTKTANSQITVQYFLSQNGDFAYNQGPIVPDSNSINNSLIYSSILYTCPESTNLGLTPSQINLQMVTAQQQQQIWHRKNTSLIGDTVQVGFTLSDAQMRDPDQLNQFAEIELHSFILTVSPSQALA